MLTSGVCGCMWQERKYLEKQQDDLEKAMKQIADQHRDNIASLERKFLEQKQQLRRGKK